MNQKRGTSCYQVGGSLGQESACYVERKADRELELALDRGQFCYVLNSRQMGKSSLRIRAMAKLQAKQTVCIFIDLTGMGTQDLTPEKWYAGIVRSIVSSCQLEFNWRKWWRDRRDLLAPVQRLSLFIEEVLLDRVAGKIAIFVDEIDRVLSQSFSLDDFFALIHSCYQKRQVNPAYDRLTFTLLGVAAPRDLIRDKTQSPFDAGKAIILEGFKLEEATPLASGLPNSTAHPQRLLAAILDWTGGQPFLTQKLCQLVGENNRAQNIVNIIQENIVTDWETKDEPEHLRTIRDRLCYRDPSKTIRLLGLYRKILQQETIKSDRSLEQTELRLSGLVVEKGGNLIVNNPIYGWIFNLAWVDRELEKLRPYSKAIACWIESDRSDESYLLRGKELQEALTWSLDKSLADVDYQFLVASQNLAKQEIQDALTAVKNASGLLATARKKARRKARKKRLSKRLSSAIALGATASIIVLRYTGILQSWEWNLLDRFFSWRLSNNIEPHITAITIDEKDIQQVGQWPIPDGIIATAIKNIKTHRPKAIALDIYKDLPAQPGTKELLKLYNSNRDIYAVEKLIGNPILPPAIPQQQVGFTDQTLDSDGKIRRALLSLVTDDRQRFSLGTQVALDYLKDNGIYLEPIDNRDRYRLGKAVFKRFESSDGGYVDADSGGYQILLNYWGTEDNFQQYSLTQVLKGRIAPETIRDRIIFIGSTAESIKDNFYTPYSFGWFGSPPKMPGVFIHANVASQIINAAMYDRPLLRTCDRAIEYLWLLFWGISGTVITWGIPRSWGVFISVLLTSILLIIICYVAFILGWWMPLVPALLTLWTTIAIALSIRNKLRDSLKFQYTLDFLLQHRDCPLESKVAIEYLKQSENQANQASIESKIKNHPSV